MTSAATLTFMGITEAINVWGHSDSDDSEKPHPEVAGSNLPVWTSLITAGEGPGHNDHHFDPGRARVSAGFDAGYKLILWLERLGWAEVVQAQEEPIEQTLSPPQLH